MRTTKMPEEEVKGELKGVLQYAATSPNSNGLSS